MEINSVLFFAVAKQIPERLNYRVLGAADLIVTTNIPNLQDHIYYIFPPSREILLRNSHGPLIDFRNTVFICTTSFQMFVGSLKYREPFILNLTKQLNLPPSLCKRFSLFDKMPMALVMFYFLRHLECVSVFEGCGSLEDELPIGLQGANNDTSFEWILTGLNWALSRQCFGCSKPLNKDPTSNTKLLKVGHFLSLLI